MFYLRQKKWGLPMVGGSVVVSYVFYGVSSVDIVQVFHYICGCHDVGVVLLAGYPSYH